MCVLLKSISKSINIFYLILMNFLIENKYICGLGFYMRWIVVCVLSQSLLWIINKPFIVAVCLSVIRAENQKKEEKISKWNLLRCWNCELHLNLAGYPPPINIDFSCCAWEILSNNENFKYFELPLRQYLRVSLCCALAIECIEFSRFKWLIMVL